VWERRRRSVLQSARANSDWMRRLLGHRKVNYGSGEGGGDEKGRGRGGGKRAMHV